MNGQIFSIEHGSFVDGPGIRTTVFFKGCNLRCVWCHNPESQSAERQRMVYLDKCKHCGRCKKVCPSPEKCILCGKCSEVCPADAIVMTGKTASAKEVLEELLADRDFYGSDGGVTFSGGECMLQIDFLCAILKQCKGNGIHTAVDTAGNVPYAYFERILPYTDLFLYDIKCFDEEKHKQYTTVSNRLLLENLSRLLRQKHPIWIRIPVIPGVNDTTEEMTQIKSFLDANGQPQKIELLPYHAMGENKYPALGREAEKFSVPSAEKMAELRAVFG